MSLLARSTVTDREELASCIASTPPSSWPSATSRCTSCACLLTILGLIFGVGSVIAMLAIAEGASLEAQRQIASLGATNIIVRSNKPPNDVNPSKQQNNDSFILSFGVTYKDYRAHHRDDSHRRRAPRRCGSSSRRCAISTRRSRDESSGSTPTSSS